MREERKHMNTRYFLQSAIILLIAFFVAGCGGGDSDQTSPTDPTSSTSQNTDQSTDSGAQDDSSSTSDQPESSTDTTTTDSTEDTSANTEPASSTSTTTATTTQTSGSSDEKIPLRLKLSQGDTFVLLMSSQETTTNSADGQSVDTESSTDMRLRYTVESVAPDGSITFISKYDSFKTEGGTNLGSTSYDSEDPNRDIDSFENRIIDSMLDKELRVTMSPFGKITSLTGFEAVLEGMMDEVDAEKRPLVEPMIESIFGNIAIEEMMQNLFTPYPEEPVGVGDSWTSSAVVSVGVSFLLDSTFTVLDRENGVATLGVESIISTNPDAEPIDFLIFKMAYADMNGTQTGTVQVDESTGLTIKATLSQDFTGELQMVSGDVDTEELTVPLAVVSTYTIEKIEGP